MLLLPCSHRSAHNRRPAIPRRRRGRRDVLQFGLLTVDARASSPAAVLRSSLAAEDRGGGVANVMQPRSPALEYAGTAFYKRPVELLRVHDPRYPNSDKGPNILDIIKRPHPRGVDR